MSTATAMTKFNLSKDLPRYMMRMGLYMWELTILPLIINTVIKNCSLHPFKMSVLLTAITLGIPHIFLAILTNSSTVKQVLGVHDIPSLNGDKNVVRKHKFGWLLFLNLLLDITSHCGIYWLIGCNYVVDEDGELKSSHLYSNFALDFMLPALIIEIIYDFVYYWWHYAGHKNTFLWTKVHSVHHEVVYPRYLDVYHMSLVETVFIRLSNALLHRLFLFSRTKLSTMVLVQHYIVFVEMVGHSGYDINAEDVSIIRWIFSQFGLTIDVKHHDYHHQKCGTNYSKRMAVWDKLFGTFYDPQIKVDSIVD